MTDNMNRQINDYQAYPLFKREAAERIPQVVFEHIGQVRAVTDNIHRTGWIDIQGNWIDLTKVAEIQRENPFTGEIETYIPRRRDPGKNIPRGDYATAFYGRPLENADYAAVMPGFFQETASVRVAWVDVYKEDGVRILELRLEFAYPLSAAQQNAIVRAAESVEAKVVRFKLELQPQPGMRLPDVIRFIRVDIGVEQLPDFLRTVEPGMPDPNEVPEE